MKSRKMTAAMFIMVTFLTCSVSAAIRELANDAFQTGDPANYQAGFVAGEIMASRFTVTAGEYPYQPMAVRVLTGDGTPGGGMQSSFILHLWEDTGGESPGNPLMTPLSVTLTAGTMNEIDLTGLGLAPIDSGAVRVGLEFVSNPPPSFFTDEDGFITQHANTLYEINFGWRYAEFFGLTGDWILRFVVDTAESSPTPTPTGPLPTSTPYPTYTPFPTYTPAPTQTPLPTCTFPPTWTPLPTTTPCPTNPPAGDPVSVTLWMPSHSFRPGQPFLLNAIIDNQGPELPEAHFICILLVGGGGWFYPSWTPFFEAESIGVSPGETIVYILPEFLWPQGAGIMENNLFIAGLMTPDLTRVMGSPDFWIWSFYE